MNTRDTQRSYCRGCQHTTAWHHQATENGPLGPPAIHWRCDSCGLIRTAYANVHDSEGLCRAVLDHSMQHRHAGRATAVDDPVGYDGLDYSDALGSLQLALWRLYSRFDQKHGDGTGSFHGYAASLLPYKLRDWYRLQRLYSRDGEPAPISVSYDQLILEDEPAAGHSRPGGLGVALRSLSANPGPDRSPDLTRALARGRRIADGVV